MSVTLWPFSQRKKAHILSGLASLALRSLASFHVQHRGTLRLCKSSFFSNMGVNLLHTPSSMLHSENVNFLPNVGHLYVLPFQGPRNYCAAGSNYSYCMVSEVLLPLSFYRGTLEFRDFNEKWPNISTLLGCQLTFTYFFFWANIPFFQHDFCSENYSNHL